MDKTSSNFVIYPPLKYKIYMIGWACIALVFAGVTAHLVFYRGMDNVGLSFTLYILLVIVSGNQACKLFFRVTRHRIIVDQGQIAIMATCGKSRKYDRADICTVSFAKKMDSWFYSPRFAMFDLGQLTQGCVDIYFVDKTTTRVPGYYINAELLIEHFRDKINEH